MKNSITMTTKGTFTLPAEVRKAMGVNQKGDKLALRFDPKSKEAVISKPADFRDIQARTAKYANAKRKPLTNPSEFYQSERSKQITHGK